MTPVLAVLAESSPLESEATNLEQLKAHLMIEFKPREQIKAHKRTERTMTTFVSKLLSTVLLPNDSGLCPGTGGDAVAGAW